MVIGGIFYGGYYLYNKYNKDLEEKEMDQEKYHDYIELMDNISLILREIQRSENGNKITNGFIDYHVTEKNSKQRKAIKMMLFGLRTEHLGYKKEIEENNNIHLNLYNPYLLRDNDYIDHLIKNL